MRLLYLLAATTMAGVAGVFTVFADLESRYDLSTTSVGLIAGSAFLAGLATQLGLSRYADRGYATILLRSGAASSAAGLLWFAAATELWQFVGARALLGAGVGLIVPAARRQIVVSSDGDQGERLGTFYAAYLSGFVLGPPIAGELTRIGDVRLPFLVFGLISAVVLIPVLSMRLPEADRGIAVASGGDKQVMRRLLRSRRIVAALLVIVSFRYSIGVFEPLWAIHLTDLGASSRVVSFSLTSFAVPMLLVAKRAGRICDRYGHRWTSLIAALATVPMMAIYGYAGVVWIVLALAVPHGLMEAILSPGSQAAVADAASESDTASAQGLAEAAGSAAAAFGALTAPAVFDHFGAGPAWLMAGFVMALLLSTSWWMDPPTPPSQAAARASNTTRARSGVWARSKSTASSNPKSRRR